MIKNYFYLIVGVLCVFFAFTHTLNGLEKVLPVLDTTGIGSSTKTTFIYVWHVVGIENLVFGVALMIMAFQKNPERVRFAAWVITVVLIMRWFIITFFTALYDKSNAMNLLPDTIAILTVVVLLVLGIRAKKRGAP